MRIARLYLCFLALKVAQWLYPDKGYVGMLLKVNGIPYVPMRNDEHPAIH